MKTPAKPPKAAAKSGPPLPPGAHTAVGSAAYRKAQGAVRPSPVMIDKSFVSSPLGSKELVVGKRHIEARDNRTRSPR
jgi:hypothetical protein